jgi:Phosphotransferase enzyme family
MNQNRPGHLGARVVAGSIEELVGGAATRKPMKAADSLSGSTFEWVEVDGERCLIKRLCVDDDWILRATGDFGLRQVELWRQGLFDRLPESLDTALLGVAAWRREDGRACAGLLMRDVSGFLVPPGSDLIALASHRQFLDHMALLHASMSDEDLDEIFPLSHHYIFLGPAMAALEAQRGTGGVPAEVPAGWSRFSAAAPRVAGLVAALLEDPSPLVEALRQTPQTMVHGDWKLGNLGTLPDGRTILLDWDRCGRGPAALDLAWYLAVNCDRLPESKEDAMEFYRGRLERHGVDTGGWWETQLSLALLGGLLQLGWAKTAGDGAEIAWWETRALAAAPLLG